MKTLGVMISPALVWDKQFTMMVNKMKEAVRKLNNTEMVTITVSMYYNIYLIKNVYYSCRILSISQKQEEILKKICKPVILRKLRLSIKFLINVLHTRKLVLEVGLMSLSTIIDILLFKLYISHNWGNSEVALIMNVLEENAWL